MAAPVLSPHARTLRSRPLRRARHLPDVQSHPPAGQLLQLAAEPVGLRTAMTGHQDRPGGADIDPQVSSRGAKDE